MTSKGQTLLGDLIAATISAKTIVENYRPPWLNGLELDFWVPDWNLAFEFQGDQHFAPIYGLESYAAQQARDMLKKKLCRQHKVMLVKFEASDMEPFRMKFKLLYHIGAIYPELKKAARKQLLRQIMRPKHGSRCKRQGIIQRKSEYCAGLKEKFAAATAYRKGSQIRKDARKDQWAGYHWWEVMQAKQRANEHYATKQAPRRPVGMGMAAAKGNPPTPLLFAAHTPNR